MSERKRIRRCSAFVALFCAIVHLSTAQESKNIYSILKSDGLTLLNDTKDFFTSPCRFNADQWLLTGGVIAGTTVLFPLDESSRSLFARNHSDIANGCADFGREYGREIYGISFSGILYAGGLAIDNRDVRMTGLMLFESIAFSGITTNVIKTVLGRSRPYYDEGPFRFRGFQFSVDHTSLPSGHSTVAFSVSSILAARLKNMYATFGLYSLAFVTAASRIYHDEHWLSDTFLGAAIGTATGLTVACMHVEDINPSSSFRIIPMLNGLRAELTL